MRYAPQVATVKLRDATTRIIVHHSKSGDVSAETIREWHIGRGFSDIGYHFVIRKSGELEVGRPLSTIGAHAKGKNLDSVGVCIVGDFSKYVPNEAQYLTLAQLRRALRTVFAEDLVVEYHHGGCPGPYFDREYIHTLENYQRGRRHG